ncbi:hypothetical protein FOL47_011271 [Perkinsus chesapeaki]|uniref:Uncharacterized protein n=1 Tax=Perkinsus chesapeaki TaxID=330153 RepID=A0A7J6KY34_PERCH|nr:hypothetical protein FOL47_011271 [Perkinsus chesapeaki]
MSNSSSRGRLFARCPTPAMPSYDSWYGQAKRLEFDGDLKGAFSAFMEAIARGDRVDSSLKDVAGLLNMVGHVHAAVRFLEDHRGLASNVIGYENLLQRLKMEADRADVLAEAAKVASSSTSMPDTIIPTTLRVTSTTTTPPPETVKSWSIVGAAITPYTCERLFPNPHKIRAIIYLNTSRTDCLVDFGTNSAARKALNVPKLVDDYVIEWASDRWQELCKRLAVHLHLDKEHHNPLPVIDYTEDNEDLQELSSRTRQKGKAYLLIATYCLNQLFLQVSNLDHGEVEGQENTSTPKVNDVGSAEISHRGESRCDSGDGTSPTMLFVDTPSIKPKTASSGQSTRAIVSPCEAPGVIQTLVLHLGMSRDSINVQLAIKMAAANAAMAQRCAEISAAAVNAVMNTNNVTAGLYPYQHFPHQQQQQPSPAAGAAPAAFNKGYYQPSSPPPCTPMNPRRLVFTTPDSQRHFPSTPSPIVDRSRFS